MDHKNMNRNWVYHPVYFLFSATVRPLLRILDRIDRIRNLAAQMDHFLATHWCLTCAFPCSISLSTENLSNIADASAHWPTEYSSCWEKTSLVPTRNLVQDISCHTWSSVPIITIFGYKVLWDYVDDGWLMTILRALFNCGNAGTVNVRNKTP